MPTRIATVMARIASLLGPRTMRLVARFNKWVTNPIQRRWAHRLTHLAVIEHRGRKTGRCYATPIMVFVEHGELVAFLNYGADADWVRNVMAGPAGVVHRGKRYRLDDPRILPADSSELPVSLRDIGSTTRRALHATLTAN